MAATSTSDSSPGAPTQSSSSPKADIFLKPQSPRKRRRSREDSHETPPHQTPKISPVSLSPKTTFPSEHSVKPFTRFAASAAERRQQAEPDKAFGRQTSPNPAMQAIENLRGTNGHMMSRVQDAPHPTASISGPVAAAVATMVPDPPQDERVIRRSPASTMSVGAPDNFAIAPAGTNGISVASPGQMSQGTINDDRSDNSKETETQENEGKEGYSNKAMTFPGPLLSAPSSDVRRGMSLPGSGLKRDNSRSPSTKKHKCPYCSTDFTRHHNLKSHLLTHSHEKPYFCETCEARFRRLHDLKRHTKLHTGERPHVCPKCDRSFARGDALARHAKGQGGCAGRRSSMGGFGDDGSHSDRRDSHGQDDNMHGLLYTGQASHEPELMDDASGNEIAGRSLPSIRRPEASADAARHTGSESSNMYQARPSSTYPPVAVRQPGSGGLYPPGSAVGGGAGGGGGGASGPNSSSSSGIQTSPGHYQARGGPSISNFPAAGPQVFSQGGMTESPKPLSPGGTASHQLGHHDSGIRRARSPSLTQQFQQQQFGRRASTLNSSPQLALPSPLSGSNHPSAPQLPSLPGLTPPDARYTLPSQTAGANHGNGQASPGFHSQPLSQNNSLSSHGTGPHANSGDGGSSAYTHSADRLWAYVRELEMKIDRLQEEVGTLKGRLDKANQ